MALSETAARMLGTLPSYYDGEPLLERIVQAWANEVDRQDALLDVIARELQPGSTTDELGIGAAWEKILGLPVNPPDATVAQRRAKRNAALQALDSGSSADVLATLAAAAGDAAGALTIVRDSPGPLEDTMTIPFVSGSYSAGVLEALARRMWPAHRSLSFTHVGGFLLDVSLLDSDNL